METGRAVSRTCMALQEEDQKFRFGYADKEMFIGYPATETELVTGHTFLERGREAWTGGYYFGCH